jgi:uncharacterized protein (TIGR02246 family)
MLVRERRCGRRVLTAARRVIGSDEQKSSTTGTIPSWKIAPAPVPVKPDAASETELLEVLERFCSALADRDAEAVMRLFIPDPDVVVITSEAPLLRGPVELRRFLDRYVAGPTTYSWEWQRHDVSIAGSVAWLLADGTETAATEDRLQRHPYRMTMVLEHHEHRWLLRQVHGSSPQ